MAKNFNDPVLVELRRKCADGTVTMEEYRQGIEYMREGRKAAHVVSAKSRAAAAPVNTDDLFNELDKL